MSYIRAKAVSADADGIGEIMTGVVGDPDIDCNIDNEMLDFVLDLIAKVNGLREDEALVVWKDIF